MESRVSRDDLDKHLRAIARADNRRIVSVVPDGKWFVVTTESCEPRMESR